MQATAPIRHMRGFTLLELLVVLALTGLLGTAVLLTLPARPAAVVREADTLAAQLQRARQEAILSGRGVQVQLDATGYRFVQQGLDGWQAMTEAPFRSRQWDEDAALSLPRRDAVQSVRFDPVGQAEPARLTLLGNGARAELRIDAAGRVQVAHHAR